MRRVDRATLVVSVLLFTVGQTVFAENLGDWLREFGEALNKATQPYQNQQNNNSNNKRYVEQVLEVQDHLNRLGYDAGARDGAAGPKTQVAIQRFQREYGLRTDGRVTPLLISELRAAQGQGNVGVRTRSGRSGKVGYSQNRQTYTSSNYQTPGYSSKKYAQNTASGGYSQQRQKKNIWALDEPSSPAAGSANIASELPLTNYRRVLLTFKYLPSHVRDEMLLEHLARIIEREQGAWKRRVDRKLKRLKRDGYVKLIKPKRLAFLYEWQALEKTNSDFANGKIMDIFLYPKADRTFVQKESGWDNRISQVVEFFLFERSSIEGRNPEFAARELLPVYSRFVRLASAKMGRTVTLTAKLPRANYDHEKGLLRFFDSTTPADEQITLFKSIKRENYFPAATKGRAVYGWSSLIGESGGDGPPQTWRNKLGLGHSDYGRNRLAPDMIALGVDLTMPTLKMSPRQAEPLVDSMIADKYTAQVVIDVEDLVPFTYSPYWAKGKDITKSVILGKVKEVRILRPNKKVLTTIPENQLRLASKDTPLAKPQPLGPEMDILGMRLGMTLQQAIDMAEKQRPNGWFVFRNPDISPDKQETYDKIYKYYRLYVAKDNTEAISLFYYPDAKKQIIGIGRVTSLPPNASNADVLETLTKRYSMPQYTSSSKNSTLFAWWKDHGTSKGCIDPGMGIRDIYFRSSIPLGETQKSLLVREIGKIKHYAPEPFSHDIIEWQRAVENKRDKRWVARNYDAAMQCGAILRAQRNGTYLMFVLQDNRRYVKIIEQNPAALEKKIAPKSIDIRL